MSKETITTSKKSADNSLPPAKAKTKPAEKSSANAAVGKKRPLARWLVFTSMKLLLVATFALAIYAIYLDGKVRRVFEGQRWQMPVNIYGQIADFTLGAALNLAHLKKALLESGYQKVAYLSAEGQFSMSADKVNIQRRSYSNAKETVDSANIMVAINAAGLISDITVNQQTVGSVALEPYLLDKILPENQEDRLLVTGDEIPAKLIETLLLVEDKDFYQHAGVSPSGILRALLNNIRAGKTVQGGSTLTQQLVKNMFLTREKTLWRKANEAIMALLLEYRYSKAQLLEAYINEVYLGQNYANGVYGFGLGASFYFDRTLQELSNEQIAMMVGIIKGPSYYDPWRFSERTKARRDLILSLMFDQQLLSVDEYSQALDSPLSVRNQRRSSKQNYPGYIQLVKQELTDHLAEENKYSGIEVYTGFSLYSQLGLADAVQQTLPRLEAINQGRELQAAMVVTDIATGTITALLGDKHSDYAGFNRALHAKRPIGSLIKPVVYLAALQQYPQYNLATVLEDKAIALRSNSGTEWRPKNYSGEFKGQVPLIDGLAYSLNVPTVNLGMQLGLKRVDKALHQLGYQQPLTHRPSLLLGAVSMSPVEVNQLYLPIAAKGVFHTGHVINEILSANDGIVWQFAGGAEPVISTDVSYLLDYALTRVTTEGTAKSLTWRLKQAQLAGKTGTTNEQRDSWFVGYDNKHLVTTWLGSDDNTPTALTGSSGALVLFAEFMKKQGVVDKHFEQPQGVSLVRFEQQTGNFVRDNCENTMMLPAVSSGLVASDQCLQEKATGIEAIGNWFNRLFTQNR